MTLSLQLIAAHMVGDYILQNDWMAANKLKDMHVRLIHAMCYTLPFLAISRDPRWLGLVCLTHFLIDCRRWAKGDKWPPKPILVDQSLHAVVLAVLGSML